MMKIPLFQVDAFTDAVFRGNPAAVCLLDEWLDEAVMQRIAAENNLAETAFLVPDGNGYGIRWFTPAIEVDLCGHATLASAHVLFEHKNFSGEHIAFQSRNSGELRVERSSGELTLDFPTDTLHKVATPHALSSALGANPIETYKGKTDYLLVYPDQEAIENIKPDFTKLGQARARGIIVTAPGTDTDFVSRFFAPLAGIDEDPVTGSAHTTLTPYWHQRTGKTEFSARQLSKRQGDLRCVYKGERVCITGRAVTYLQGEITV